jgi:hypothetical protein
MEGVMTGRMGIIAALVGSATLVASGALHAQDTAQQACPAGYALIEQICVSSTTGDVVVAQTIVDQRAKASQVAVPR